MRSGSGRFSENPRECDRADHSAYKLGPSSHRSAPWTDLRAHGFVWVFWLRVLLSGALRGTWSPADQGAPFKGPFIDPLEEP